MQKKVASIHYLSFEPNLTFTQIQITTVQNRPAKFAFFSVFEA